SLAWGVRTLLADLGHWCSISEGTEWKCLNGSTEPTRSDWFIVRYSPERKYARTVDDDEFVYRPILSVEPVHISAPVFNVEVEEDHSYVSDFVLHNCEAYMAAESRYERPVRRGRGDAGGRA